MAISHGNAVQLDAVLPESDTDIEYSIAVPQEVSIYVVQLAAALLEH